jgi:hypothetical protein
VATDGWRAGRKALNRATSNMTGNDPLGFVIGTRIDGTYLRPGQKALVPAAAAAVAPEAAPDDAPSGALDADELARLQAMADEFWADDEEVEL